MYTQKCTNVYILYISFTLVDESEAFCSNPVCLSVSLRSFESQALLKNKAKTRVEAMPSAARIAGEAALSLAIANSDKAAYNN